MMRSCRQPTYQTGTIPVNRTGFIYLTIYFCLVSHRFKMFGVCLRSQCYFRMFLCYRMIFHLFTDINEFICPFSVSNRAPTTKIGKLYQLSILLSSLTCVSLLSLVVCFFLSLRIFSQWFHFVFHRVLYFHEFTGSVVVVVDIFVFFPSAFLNKQLYKSGSVHFQFFAFPSPDSIDVFQIDHSAQRKGDKIKNNISRVFKWKRCQKTSTIAHILSIFNLYLAHCFFWTCLQLLCVCVFCHAMCMKLAAKFLHRWFPISKFKNEIPRAY